MSKYQKENIEISNGVKIVIITTSSDPLAGVFWKAYNGPVPEAVLLINDQEKKNILIPFFLFGIGGVIRLILARYLKLPLPKDKKLGLHLDYRLLKSKFYRFPSMNELAVDTLKRINPDIIVSVGAPVIFKKEVLEIPKHTLNVHNGLLPKYRGHFGTFWELYNGEEKSCITIHKMEEKVDSGDVIALECLPVKSLLNLLIEKKYRGGILLSRVLQEGTFNKIERSGESNYFNFPTLKDVLKFRKKHV